MKYNNTIITIIKCAVNTHQQQNLLIKFSKRSNSGVKQSIRAVSVTR